MGKQKCLIYILLVILCFSSFPACASEGDAVKAYFDCLMRGDMSARAHLERISGLTKQEIYRFSWLIETVRPLSVQKFKAGEITNIKKFPKFYEITFLLPDYPSPKTAIEEWEALDKKRGKKKYKEEKRKLYHEDGKLAKELFTKLETQLLKELRDGLETYRKRGREIPFVEGRKSEAFNDGYTLQQAEKQIYEEMFK